MGGDGGTRTSRNRSGVERASAAETLSPRGSPSDLKSADVKEAEQRHATLDCSTGDGRSAAGGAVALLLSGQRARFFSRKLDEIRDCFLSKALFLAV